MNKRLKIMHPQHLHPRLLLPLMIVGGGSSVLKRGLSHPDDEVVEDAAVDGPDEDQGELSVLLCHPNNVTDAKRIKR